MPAVAPPALETPAQGARASENDLSTSTNSPDLFEMPEEINAFVTKSNTVCRSPDHQNPMLRTAPNGEK